MVVKNLTVTLLLLGALHFPCAYAGVEVCQDESKWLRSASEINRDQVLLKIAEDTEKKVVQIMSEPKAKPNDQDWAYKIFSISNLILSQSPYASLELKSLFSRLEVITSGMIRGEIDFKEFKQQLRVLVDRTDAIKRKSEISSGKFMEIHKEEVKNMSSCILVTAMFSATKKPAAPSSPKEPPVGP